MHSLPQTRSVTKPAKYPSQAPCLRINMKQKQLELSITATGPCIKAFH